MWRPGLLAAIAATSAAACTQVLGIPEIHRGACSPDAAFTELAPVRGLGSGGVQSAQLSSDELTIVFSRLTIDGPPDRPVQRYGDLYIAQRDHIGDDFRDDRALDEVNSDFDEFTASLSDDRRTLYFDRQDHDERYHIFMASRDAANGSFGIPSEVSLGDPASSDFEPFITPDGLYFGSTRRDGLASLFLAPGRGTSFVEPQWLSPLETEEALTAYENPVVSADGLTIYFGAAPDGAIAKDIWLAERATRNEPFEPPRPVSSINTDRFETPSWISRDGCRLYFATDRSRRFELWMASRRQ